MDQQIPQQLPSANDPVVDPVCGMSVELQVARGKALMFAHDGVEYGFCGRGCRLEFEDDPATYLSADYLPTM